jgi:hypothetical protein
LAERMSMLIEGELIVREYAVEWSGLVIGNYIYAEEAHHIGLQVVILFPRGSC